MINQLIISIFILLLLGFSYAQVKIVSYILLNYPGSDTTTRNLFYRTTISSLNPDILVVQEVRSQSYFWLQMHELRYRKREQFSNNSFYSHLVRTNTVRFYVI